MDGDEILKLAHRMVQRNDPDACRARMPFVRPDGGLYDDAVQECCAALVEFGVSESGKREAVNAVRRLLRRGGRGWDRGVGSLDVVSRDQDGREVPLASMVADESLAEVGSGLEARETLELLFSEMSQWDVELITLRLVDQLPWPRVAERVGMAEPAARKAFERAIRCARRRLEGRGYGDNRRGTDSAVGCGRGSASGSGGAGSQDGGRVSGSGDVPALRAGELLAAGAVGRGGREAGSGVRLSAAV